MLAVMSVAVIANPPRKPKKPAEVRKTASDSKLSPHKLLELKYIPIADPTYDFSFKYLFHDPIVLIGFLNALYYPNAGEYDEKIRRVEYRSEAQLHEKVKDAYFDVSCRCYVSDGIRVGRDYYLDVEMQRNRERDFIDRSIFYGSRLLSSRLPAGDKCTEYPKIRVICFLNYTIDPSEEPIYLGEISKINFKTKEYRGTLSGILNWTYIQLDRFYNARETLDYPNALRELLTVMNAGRAYRQDGQYLCHVDDADQYKDPVTIQAIARLNELSTGHGLDDYTADILKSYKHNGELDFARQEGRQEGIAIGEERGIAIGRAEEREEGEKRIRRVRFETDFENYKKHTRTQSRLKTQEKFRHSRKVKKIGEETEITEQILEKHLEAFRKDPQYPEYLKTFPYDSTNVDDFSCSEFVE